MSCLGLHGSKTVFRTVLGDKVENTHYFVC